MLAGVDRTGEIAVRTVALVLAALLALPAAIVLLRPAPRTGEDAPRRALDALWALVPITLLLVLIGLSAAA